jgi:hypothetical protein
VIRSVAGDVVDVFRQSPSLLFIMLLNIMFLGGLGYLLVGIGERRSNEFERMMKIMDTHYQDMMDLCIERRKRNDDTDK